MLTTGQKALFDTFGFLFIKGLFSQGEVSEIVEEAEHLWEQERSRPDFNLSDDGSQHTGPFVELSPKLFRLVDDERIYPAVDRLIGPDMVWAGSEGNITGYGAARWHPDRRNHAPGDLDYPRLKVMLYLDEVHADSGALRVIPGSHRSPLHDGLYTMLDSAAWEPIPEADNEADMPFGVAGDRMPCYVVESNPGDVLFFNQCLFHAAYHASSGRRYIALKFAGKPTTDQHIDALRRNSAKALTPHESLLTSENPRVRALVQPLADIGPA